MLKKRPRWVEMCCLMFMSLIRFEGNKPCVVTNLIGTTRRVQQFFP